MAVLVRDRFGALPWRFDAESYRAGLLRHRGWTRPLDGRAVRADAHPELVRALQIERLELHEQALLDELLDDLAAENRELHEGGKRARWCPPNRDPSPHDAVAAGANVRTDPRLARL